ncbi:phospholipid-transporting ATPase ID [Micropterus salmoides]|uniref:phospholipid-transporting ATPase ID n=1 Tax=Micropterus salmoides TaxID=27706 RepID=UPI0018EB041C|nr:phospholipid-transporting ATPase ID [Micropterus salmoides]XP_038562063.1 phospholipid-transporting ATPase ID [Micropterus salmoides]XP_038562064.1 phospholipid-transporting ATPase ID [Micropterus salmoides]XP_038562065.1 phospholipid-transporting ATPase ID [Micropterus salmoides]
MAFWRRNTHIEKERRVKANAWDYNDKFSYADNRIKTSKYNILTFLPINFFEQFQRVANAYFLVLSILQLIPEISSLSWFTTIVPLVLVLVITAVKDATDDYFRHKSDQQVNNRQSQVLLRGSLQNEKWMNVRVGDIIKLENNQFVAADILLLCSSEPYGLCYIETAELDGETNLKVRQALTVTSGLGDITKLMNFDGEVVCEPPNNKLDKFTGTLYWGGNKYPLDNDKMLLRGCVLRNTEWCFGMVIFAGLQTKLMQNSGRTTFKRTSIDKLMNTLVLWIFASLICMGVILAIGNTIWESCIGRNFQVFLPWEGFQSSAVFSGFLTFWSYIIILNTVVPISLYVSVEVLRLGHSYFINWDGKMYHSQTDTAAEARTTTLTEELGQVEFIFSDKTGTLTQNIMLFSKCSINGQTYGEVYNEFDEKVEITEKTACVDFSFNPLCDRKFKFYDGSLVEAIKLEDPTVQEFFRLLALCHTVMPEEKSEGNLVYQAQSPDEGALVTAARNFGFVFRARTPETITLYEMGQAVTYQLLAILDFNNVRKRMSVIVRNPQGKIKLYSKGADTIIFELLDSSSEALMHTTSEHLSEFAGEGLRTLALAYKDVDEDYFAVWTKRLLFASTVIENREDQLAVLYEEIEQGLKLLGATAIEDKLQEGVPETIACLNRANIKIWVLTGDKLETAMNIGYSCNMLRDDMNEVFIISGYTLLEVQQQLRSAKEHILGVSRVISAGDVQMKDVTADDVFEETLIAEYALVINGHSLTHALEPQLEHVLLDVACLCKTVICCRVTPMQKAQVVELVKRHKKAVTLAIGDGANDVSMIKTAHIGVGISGQEGMQAVLASDYSFAQFRYLQRLLLVHGRWSYFRMCNFLYYFFYKNFAFTLVHFWYGFFCGFSAQTVYDQWFITLFNIVYTSLPVLAMGLFDQDVNDQNSLRYPSLYKPGQQNLLFNKCQFFLCTVQGVCTSFLLFFIPYGAFSVMVKEDGSHLSDQQAFAVTIATSLVIVVSVQIGLDKHYWTAVNHLLTWGSLTVYFAILFAMQSDGIFGVFPRNFPFIGTARNCLSEKSVWLVILLTTVVCVVPGLVVRFLRADLFPTLTDKVRHLQQSRKRDRPQEKNLRRVRRTSSRRSAYAFSHQQGYGELITSGKNMRTSIVSSACSPERTPNSWIENVLKRKNEVSCVSDKSTEAPESDKRAKQTPE